MISWLNNVQLEAEKTNNLLLREFCHQLSDYLSHGTGLHYGREKTLEFIRSCLETETSQIGFLVSQGLEKLIQEEEACRECSAAEKQDFLQFLLDAFPNGSPLVERELVGTIRLILNVVRCQSLSLSGHILSKLIQFTLGVLRTSNPDLRRETCQLCASKLEVFYRYCPIVSSEHRQFNDDGSVMLNPNEFEYYRQLVPLMEYQTSLINELSRKSDQTLQRIFVLELHELLIRSLSRTIYYYQPFIDFVWKRYSPAVISFLGSPIIDARCIMYVKNNASDPHLRRTVYRIILNLICFIAPIGSLRSVSETLFQRLCLSQTANERSDLLIVLNEVITSRSLVALISPPWIHSSEPTNDADLSLFRKIISLIAECSSSDERILVNNAYLCLNHCLEQLIRFCEEALFFDHDEEQAVRRVYRKFGYPIVPTLIETSQLLKFCSNADTSTKFDEISLTSESTTDEKVLFYIFHLKMLLKTSDQQNLPTVPDVDDALLVFSSFISNEYATKTSMSSDSVATTIVTNPDGIYATTIWFLWYCARRQLNELFDMKPTTTSAKSAFVTDIMNSGLMLCIEPDWMDTLYDRFYETFNVFEGLSDHFRLVLHQMLIDIRPFNIRSIKPPIGDVGSKHDACSTALSVCHRLVQMCWSALLGALTPMLTKTAPIESDVSSSNSVLTNTISEKFLETHELVFQGLKLVFRLAVLVGLPNNACYVLHCVVSTIEQSSMIDHQRKLFPKQNRLHYLDIMAINFILQLYMSDINQCPSVTYKHILRCCVHLCLLEMQCCPPKEKLDLTLHQHGYVSCELNNGNTSSSNDVSTLSLLQLSNIDKTGHIHEKSCPTILQALSCRSDKLFEIVVRHLDLESLLEFFEQIRLLTETTMTKRVSDMSPMPPQNLFPLHVVIERVGDMTLGIIASLRPRYHVCKIWSCVSQIFIQGATHRDIQLAKRTISHMHRHLRSWLAVRPEYSNSQLNETFFKPFEHLICTEQCDSIVENQIVNSICELVELNTNAIMSGWRSIFACLKAVKIEQQRRSIGIKSHRDGKTDEDETEKAGVELYRVNAILEVLEAFFSCENLNVISQASVDCLQCLFCYLREPEPFTPMANSPFDDDCDENDDEHNQIELVLPALNMIQKFTTIFVHCYVTSADYVFATKKRTRQFESTSFTYSTFSNFSPSFFSHLDMSNSSETFLRSFELKLVGFLRQLTDDLDLIDSTTHLLNVWSYMIEGLTDTIFSCSNHYHIKIIDQYFLILKLTFDSVGHRFSIYLICCVIIPWLQSFVCSNFLKMTSSLRKMTIFRRHAQRQSSTFMNLNAWRLFLGNLLEHVLYIFEMAKEFEEYHHILFDCFQSMLIDWLCVANEFVGRLGLSCIKHLLSHISDKFDPALRAICIDNLQHALLLTSLPTEYLMYEFLISTPDDLLRNVRVFIQNDSISSSTHGLVNGDSSIFPICEQLFHEHQQTSTKSIDGKLFRLLFSSTNESTSHEIQMKTFVYLNYFHLQLIHIIGELKWIEFVPSLSQSIDLAERFDLSTSNFGLRSILQQLFVFDPPAMTFQHLKRVAFQYLVDYLMIGVKDELVKQSIDSANPTEISNVPDEYVSFPESPSPSQDQPVVDSVERKKGFFAQFATLLRSTPHRYIDLLKTLSDGIADLLYIGSNRLESQNEIDSASLFLLRADRDLVEKFLHSASSNRRESFTENDVEYFIATQEMICRVLDDHRPRRKSEANVSTPSLPRRTTSVSSPLPSPHQRFFPSSFFNETTKINAEEHQSLQETLSTRNAEHIALILKFYVDGWNDLCLYLAKALQENGCLTPTSGSGNHCLISSLERWLFVCATNATNRQLKNLLLDILMRYGGKEVILNRT